ncbi:dTMP kinase [Engelhardtia mirabilis]|uniref:Thymidylate kinase n=1 Tax=Engelhardtia mirabilis TaxID=2528011 RepID=A0A518BK99_9BACT|nr:Thymidylate kinase [Planctomycetes bacterium Pla133]QDV01730.1 Thymidylate kinase [Planctomycetes bacterium Pla86]
MSPTSDPRPVFVVLDGVDGCGKSTQAERLCDALRREGREPLHLREPGSTGAGERLRAILLDPEVELGAGAETLMFAAARRQLLDELVRPALIAGRDVVCERGNPATYAYQAVAGELDPDAVLALLDGWCRSPAPDLELVLSIDVDEAAARRGGEHDRMEQKGLEFQRRVAKGLADYVQRRDRARSLDAAGSTDEVAQRVLQEVRRARG